MRNSREMPAVFHFCFIPAGNGPCTVFVRVFGQCCEGQYSSTLGRFKLHALLLEAGLLTSAG